MFPNCDPKYLFTLQLSRLPQALAPKGKTTDFEKQWEVIAEVANKTLDPSAWSAPPWSAHQWVVLAGCIDIAIEEVNSEI